jgi:hypothetical protein
VIEPLVAGLALHSVPAHAIGVDLAAGQIEAPHPDIGHLQRVPSFLGGRSLRQVVGDRLGVVDNDAQHVAQLAVGAGNELHHRVQVPQRAIGQHDAEALFRIPGHVGPRRQAPHHARPVVGVDALEGLLKVGRAPFGVEAPEEKGVAIPAAFPGA